MGTLHVLVVVLLPIHLGLLIKAAKHLRFFGRGNHSEGARRYLLRLGWQIGDMGLSCCWEVLPLGIAFIVDKGLGFLASRWMSD